MISDQERRALAHLEAVIADLGITGDPPRLGPGLREEYLIAAIEEVEGVSSDEAERRLRDMLRRLLRTVAILRKAGR